MQASDAYMLESPDVGKRRLNNKAGVQLAPLQHAQPMNRQSMLSMKEVMDPHGSDSHPILRVQNFKKPMLDKIPMKQPS